MRRPERAFSAMLTAAAVAVVAPLAHLSLDVVADFMLPHDPMDDVAHGSRAVLALAALAVVLLVVLRLAWSALQEARGAGAGRVVLGRLVTEPLWRVIARTAALALVVLAMMEAADVHAAGQAIDDLGDLFAGSPSLAAAVVLVVSTAVVLVLRAALRLAADTHRRLVGILLVFFLRRVAGGMRAAERRLETQRRRRALTEPVRSRGLRAPPAPVPVRA